MSIPENWHDFLIGVAGFIAVAGVILGAILHGGGEHDDTDVDR